MTMWAAGKCPMLLMKCGEQVLRHAVLKVRFPLFTSKVNYRNHRKIVVIDGRVAYTGGMNIALRYMKGFPWGYGGILTLK